MKATRCRKRRLFLTANKLVSVITLIFFSASTIFALPAGQQVVNGQASFTTQGNNLTITNSPNSIINWQGFSINTNEAVRFMQQSSASAVLNRVIGQDPSRILGLLQSNGRVFLVNPNGILFGQGARVDVNGLVASTLNISNQDFLAGKYNFTAGAFAGPIQNQGTITTPGGGKVYLIAPDIENSGIINSPKGDVILAAGHSVYLVDSLDPDISVVVSAPENKAVNLGQIVAQSGSVGIYGGLIQQKGIVNANSAVVGENGRIFFKAKKDITLDQGSVTSAQGGGTIKILGSMDSGTVTVNGALDASAPNGGDGGFIETSASKVSIGDNAAITTLAPYGKTGTWLIDPTNYTIGSAAGDDITGSLLGTQLYTANITIETSSAGAQAGDIAVNDSVTWTTGNTLTLKAHQDINVNAPITSTYYGPGGRLILRADSDANGTGTVAFGGVVGAGGGSVNMNPMYGTVSIYYNPTDYLGTTYNTDVANFNTRVTAATKTYYMLVNDVGQESGGTLGLQAMNTNLAGTYALGKNIDATATSGWNSGAGFVPVGNYTAPFTGVFDGLGNTITGLTINSPSTSYVGLFGHIAGGQVNNVGQVNGNITGKDFVGGLVGWNDGGSISNSYNTGAVTGGSGLSYYVGGLVGYNTGSISNSYSTGAVIGAIAEGGLVGWNDGGSISNSYSTGTVSGGFSAVGGLVGQNDGSIAASYWDKETSGQASGVGGGSTTGVTGLTTAQMMTQATFTGGQVPWDFTNTWWMSDANTRPFLRSEYSTTITNAHQLQLMALNPGASYSLANNIDMSELTQASGLWKTAPFFVGDTAGFGFVPVGDSETLFTGAFHGNGYTITGLSINRPSTLYVGLFGYTSPSSIISNVSLANVNITGDRWVGGLAGENDGAIDNCTSTGTVSGSSYVGGLVGDNYGSISNSSSTATVSGSSIVGGLVGINQFGGSIINSSYSMGTVTGSSFYVGGLVGWNEGTIDSSSSTGALIDGSNYVGGLVGLNQNDGGISNSNSSSAVIGDFFVGGLAGENDGTISNSYSTGTVTGTGDLVGGLVGVNNATIENNSYSTGDVIGNSYVGGLVGGNYALGLNGASIRDSYSTGTVTGTGTYEGGTDAYIGGLVGFNDTSSTITNSHSTGVVTGVGSYVGGLVGKNLGGIDSSCNEGTVTGSGDYVGGLVGWNDTSGIINKSYNTSTGAVTGSGYFVGGLVGKNLGGIDSSWNEGTVTGSSDFVGGLVGYNDTSGSIRNSSSMGDVNGVSYVGGLAGNNDGIIDNSSSTGTVIGTGIGAFVPVGGLVGVNYISGSITNSYSTGNVKGDGDIVGGLAGGNQGSISSSSHSTGTVSGIGQVGGLVGWHSDTGIIDSSYNTGTVTGTGLLYVGGLAGLSAGGISNSYSTGVVSGVGEVGGLVGGNIGIIDSSYSTGAVTGTGDIVGGLAGLSGGGGSITNSYSTGVVSGTGIYIGGLVGFNGGSITNSYSTGAVSGTGSYVGGLVGYNYSSITASYWDKETSDPTIGVGGGSTTGVTGLTTAQMMTQTTFPVTDWDFVTIWRIYEGHTAPLLKSFLTPLTITATDVTKVYDGTSVGLTNVVYSDPAAPGSGNLFGLATPYGSVAKNNVGTYVPDLWSNQKGYDITVGTGPGTYGTLTVSKAPLTITAVTNTKTYDGGLTAAATPTVAGIQSGDTVTGLAEAYADKNAANGKTLNVSAYTVNDGNSGNNYTVSTVADTTGVINKAPLTITAVTNTKTYDGGLTAAATPTVDGIQSGDTVTGLVETYADKNAVTGKTLNVSAYTVNDGNSGNNYTVSTVADTTGVINKAPLTITAVTNTKTYDGGLTAAATPTVAGIQSGDTVTGLAEAYADKNAANGKTLNVSAYTVNDGNSGNNYTVSTVADTTGVINKAPLTITAVTNTKTYDGGLTAAATPTVAGIQSGDTVTGLVETYADKNAVTGKTLNVSAYTVNDGNSGNNYTVSTVANTTGVINKAPLTITAVTNTKTYDGGLTAAATPTVAGIQSGDTVTGLAEAYADKNAANGKTLNVSSYTVNDGNSGNNYTVSTVADTTGVINKANLTVTAATNTKDYDGNTSAAAIPTVSGLQMTDMVTGLSETYDNKDAGTGKTLTPIAIISDGNNGNNYNVTYINNTTGVINPGQIVSGMIDVAAGGKTIDFVVNGTLVGQTSTNMSGDYSFMLPLNSIPGNSALLAYVENDSLVKSASIYLSSGGNITNLLLSSNTVTAKSGGGTMSNSTLETAKGSLTSNDIPYTVSGTDLTLSSGFNFLTASGTSYSLNGNITTTNGSQAYNGPVTLVSNAALKNTGTGGNISFGGAVTGAGRNLTLNTTGTVSQTAPITAAGLELLGAGAIYTLTNAGNAIATLAGNTGTVNFTNNTGLAIGTVNTAGLATSGDLTLNSGATTTDVSAITSGGTVSITAHSPLTIGPGGVFANGNITLEASPTQTTDDLAINGMILSSNGNIILRAGGSIVLGAGGSLSARYGTITMTDQLNAPVVTPQPPVSDQTVPAATGNEASSSSTVTALKTTEGTTIATVETISDSDEKEDEERKKKKEGGEQTTDDKKKEAKVKNYCN